ncbi:MAG: 30S ribosomal protein S12 methylthiotransferase RimO [Clostridia bacterium]
MAKKIGFISLGCAKNLVDSEQMLSRLDDAGYEITGEIENTDAVIINTCGFIASARLEAYENIREVGLLKSEGKVGRILVAGCLPEREREELLSSLPEIDALIGCGSFDEIVAAVEKSFESEEKFAIFSDINKPIEETGRVLTTPAHMAYLKIAEGCDNRCSYCVIPSLRGSFRSRELGDIISEAESLVASGATEIIVVAQDTTRYGLDLYGERRIAQLLSELCKIDGLVWLRLHYLYPDEISDELIDTIAREPKILKYLDIPIQHVSDRILKAMNRRGDRAYLSELFTKLRKRIPGVVIRTSLIVGLPGETDEEYEELCDFVRLHKIERAGTFQFSPEEGTPAAQMDNQIDEATKSRRAELLGALCARNMDEWNEKQVGTTMTVICEGFDKYAECYFGRTFADSPEIDGKVFFTAPQGSVQTGNMISVHITEVLDGDLIGEKA